ncbi:MAG: lamin tail domain-containing protein, partial [Verrucomicrobiota bacterium]
NYSPDTYYSLQKRDGFLSLHVEEHTARPFVYPAPTYPAIFRNLSATNDWVIQTKLQMETRQFGDYLSGLLVEVVEGGANKRYAFGVKDGTTLQVLEQLPSGTETVLGAVAVTENQHTIRIHRTGTALVFEYRNGEGTWIPVHTESLLPGTMGVQAGVFASTESAQSIRAAFDYVMTIDITTSPSLYEGLRISEIMYDPPGGSEYEYLELVNLGLGAIDLAGVKFVATEPFDELVLSNRTLNVGERVVVVNNSVAMQARYGPSIVPFIAGEWAGGKLSNEGERITLVDPGDQLILSFAYDVDGRWPARAGDEGGSSLEVLDAFADLEDPANWQASSEYLGSPGAAGSGPVAVVVINEILSHTDLPALDTIELYNTSGSPVTIGNWYLSDTPGNYQMFKIPASTVIPGNGYLTFDESQFNPNGEWNPSPGVPAATEFGLSSKGDQLYLVEADGGTNLLSFVDEVEFDAAENGVSFGRYLNSIGTEYMPAQTNVSTGSTNAGPRIGPVVISEIMYHPVPGGSEYVELQNISDGPVPLYHPVLSSNTWKIAGIDFDFPGGIVLNPKEVILVTAGDPLSFRSQHGVAADVRIFGPYGGLLQDNGENIRLRKPDTPDPGEPSAPYITVDEVRYEVSPPWPVGASGAGPSLERLDVLAFANDPANWGATGGTGTPGETTLPATTPLIRLSAFQVEVSSPEFSDASDATIQLWNGGLGTLAFSVSDDQPWLSIAPASNTSTGTNDQQTTTLSFDTDSLLAGQYVANLTVSDPAALNSPLTIPVILTVHEPLIQANPSAISHRVHVGFDAASLPLQVWNGDEAGTLLSYTLSDNTSWFSVTPAGGSSSGPFDVVGHTLQFTTAGLPVGSLSGLLSIDDTLNSAPNDGLTVPVSLDIVQMDVETLVATNFGVGRATLNGVFSNTVDGADVWVFYGVVDGGTDSNAWENSAYVGLLPDGEIHHTANDIYYGFAYTYRFFIRNAYGEAWSTAADPFLSTPPSGAFSTSLNVKTYDTTWGDSFLNPIVNLLNVAPSGTGLFTGEALNYPNWSAIQNILPGTLTQDTQYSVSWEGVMIIGPDDLGTWTLGTRSDDGSVWFIDLNLDGDYIDPGEFVVDNRGLHGCQSVVGEVTFTQIGCYPMVFAFYENGGGECMAAKFAKGAGIAYGSLAFVDSSPGSNQPFAPVCPMPDEANILTLAATDVGFEQVTVHAGFDAPNLIYTLKLFYGTSLGGTNENAWQHAKVIGTFPNTVNPDIPFTVNQL